MAPTRPWASSAALTASLASFRANSGLVAMRWARARVKAASSAARDHVVDHAQRLAPPGADPVGGEQQLLGLAQARAPRVGEVLDPAHAHAARCCRRRPRPRRRRSGRRARPASGRPRCTCPGPGRWSAWGCCASARRARGRSPSPAPCAPRRPAQPKPDQVPTGSKLRHLRRRSTRLRAGRGRRRSAASAARQDDHLDRVVLRARGRRRRSARRGRPVSWALRLVGPVEDDAGDVLGGRLVEDGRRTWAALPCGDA